jgi:hypothetical protein
MTTRKVKARKATVRSVMREATAWTKWVAALQTMRDEVPEKNRQDVRKLARACRKSLLREVRALASEVAPPRRKSLAVRRGRKETQ